MRYLISMTVVDDRWHELSEAEQQAVMQQHDEFRSALEAAGCFVASYALAPPAEATTVRRDARGGFSVEPGPYTGAAEYVGGLYVIEAGSPEEAVAWARRGRFMVGANEVRAIAE